MNLPSGGRNTTDFSVCKKECVHEDNAESLAYQYIKGSETNAAMQLALSEVSRISEAQLYRRCPFQAGIAFNGADDGRRENVAILVNCAIESFSAVELKLVRQMRSAAAAPRGR